MYIYMYVCMNVCMYVCSSSVVIFSILIFTKFFVIIKSWQNINVDKQTNKNNSGGNEVSEQSCFWSNGMEK